MSKDSTHVSAPGRVILFGDYAIDFGGTGLALAVEYRAHCKAKIDSGFMVNGKDLDQKEHPYTRGAVLQAWTDMDRPISIQKESMIPEGTGLGEESASTVACLGAISMIHDHLIFEEIARNAFEVHYDVEKTGTPLDVSISTHGRGVLISCIAKENPLWSFQKEEKQWTVHDLDIPDMNLVLGYTGVPSPKKEIISKIHRFHERNSFARDIMKDMIQISSQGHEAMVSGDLELIGQLMNQYHKSLVTLGAGHPMLDKLVKAVSRHSYGAKLTGFGGGGSIIALTNDPERVVQEIEKAGGKGFILKLASQGLRLED